MCAANSPPTNTSACPSSTPPPSTSGSVLRLELDNLLNQRHYAYTIFNGINTYTYDYTLCGRTVMLRATFKL